MDEWDEEAAGDFEDDTWPEDEPWEDEAPEDAEALEPIWAAPPDDAAHEAPGAAHRPSPKVGRNDPCPCGSGKKYKRCCVA
jgi:uncharacterized protein YecA (UPF0149 family)